MFIECKQIRIITFELLNDDEIYRKKTATTLYILYCYICMFRCLTVIQEQGSKLTVIWWPSS